jgi:hypothetical protein
MTSFAAGKTSPADFSPAEIFAWVDYSARPAGGRNQIERALCGPQTDIGLSKVRTQLDAYRPQVRQALADGRVKCTPHGDATTCEVRASEEGQATLTFEIVHNKLVGFAKHETFMIDDTSKDEKRRDQAFARLHSMPCEVPVRDDCKQKSGTCLAEQTERCADDIRDLRRTEANSKNDEVYGPRY